MNDERGFCMSRYGNLIHAQRKCAVELRLAELAAEDPEHYYQDEWTALYDAALDLALGLQGPVA